MGIIALLLVSAGPCLAQEAAIPRANASRFGFPYSPPRPDERGVTPFHRYMLYGEPEFHFQPRPEDEIWLISSRGVGCGPPAVERLQCQRMTGSGQWESLPLENLVARPATAERGTVLFIHGYDTDAFWAERRGKQAYQALYGNCPSAPPVRWVIWSWPSESQGVARSFAEKNQRALLDGGLLGEVLGRLQSNLPVGLVAYSLGTQIVLTALEARTSEAASDSAAAATGYRVAFIAPVAHCNWPCRPEQVGNVRAAVARMAVFNNSRDRALRAYRLFCNLQAHHRHKPPRVSGVALISRLPEVQAWDVGAAVGREHNLINYLCVTSLRTRVRNVLAGWPDGPKPLAGSPEAPPAARTARSASLDLSR